MKHASELLKFWGIHKLPFGPLEDSARMFVPSSWQTSLNRLVLACERHSQMITVLADPGHGKTSLSKWLYQQIDTRHQEVFLIPVLKREFESDWLLRRVAKLLQIGVDQYSSPMEACLAGLEELKEEQRGLCLIIDDAHLVDTELGLQELHTLLGLGHAFNITINVILFGLPILHQQLSQLPSLWSRTSLSVHLKPLSFEEASDYIRKSLLNHHLDPKMFNLDAVRAIFNHSQGRFLRMNQLMENLLCEAFIRRQKRINRDMIETTMQLLPQAPCSPSGQSQSEQKDVTNPMQSTTEPNPSSSSHQEKNSSISLTSLFYRSDDEPQSGHEDVHFSKKDSAS